MPEAARTDEELVLEYGRTGRPELLDVLARRHWKDAYRLTRRVLADPGAAEDAAQEAFIALCRHARQFQGGRAFGPWFSTLVINAARNVARDTRTRQRHEGRAGARRSNVAPAADEPLGAAELEERIGDLPFDLRVPLLLHFFEGRSFDEMAQVLECPRSTVQSRVGRGLERLRADLAGAGVCVTVGALGERLLRAPLDANATAAPPRPTAARLSAALGRRTTPFALKVGAFVIATAAAVLATRTVAPARDGGDGHGGPASVALPSASESAREIGLVESRSDGHVLGGNTVALEASAPKLGSAPVSIRRGRGRIYGRAIAAGEPLRNATLRRHVDVSGIGGDHEENPIFDADGIETDASGAYSLNDLWPARYSIEAWTTGFAPSRFTVVVREGESVREDLVFRPGSKLSGRLRLPPGADERSVDLSLSRTSDEFTRTFEGDAREGRYSFDDLPEGPLHLYAALPGALGRSASVTIAGDTEGPEISFVEGETVSGRLRARGGEPWSNQELRVALSGHVGCFEVKVTSAADGGFAVSSVPAGTWSITVGPLELGERVVAGPLDLGELVLPSDLAKATLRGTVLTESGAPVSSATVTLRGAANLDTQTDERGAFTLGPVPSGSVRLQARAGDLLSFAPTAIEVGGVDPSPVVLTVAQGGSIRGRVSAPDDRLERDDLAVEVEPVAGGAGGTGRVRPDGRYRVSGLAPGEYTVSVGGARARCRLDPGGSAEVDLSIASEKERLDVVLEGLPGDSNAIAYAFWKGSGDGARDWSAAGQVVDEHALLDFVPAGAVDVKIEVELPRREGQGSCTWTFRRAAQVLPERGGRVAFSWPSASTGGTIEGSVDGSLFVETEGLEVEYGGNVEGTFRLGPLPPGRYRVGRSRDEGRVAVEVRAGETVKLALP
jgi:RNA polymerase sigma factor (sigma-70 family)